MCTISTHGIRFIILPKWIRHCTYHTKRVKGCQDPALSLLSQLWSNPVTGAKIQFITFRAPPLVSPLWRDSSILPLRHRVLANRWNLGMNLYYTTRLVNAFQSVGMTTDCVVQETLTLTCLSSVTQEKYRALECRSCASVQFSSDFPLKMNLRKEFAFNFNNNNFKKNIRRSLEHSFYLLRDGACCYDRPYGLMVLQAAMLELQILTTYRNRT